MEFSLFCINPLQAQQFGQLCGEMDVRIVQGKLAKPNTGSGVLVFNLSPTIGYSLFYRYIPRTGGPTTLHHFITHWVGPTIPPAADGIVLREGTVYVAIATPTSIGKPPDDVLAEVKAILAGHGILTATSPTSELASKFIEQGFNLQRSL